MPDAVSLTRKLLNLIEQLRRAGYNIGARQHIDAQHLLIHLALRGEFSKNPEKIRLLLAPLLCRSPHEQAEFARYFKPLAEYFAAVQRPVPIRPTESAAERIQTDRPELAGNGKPEKSNKSFFAGALLGKIGAGSGMAAALGLVAWLIVGSEWQFAAAIVPLAAAHADCAGFMVSARSAGQFFGSPPQPPKTATATISGCRCG
ncbi:MAG: hypothetical protein GY862_10055 [Gammaproteobacteria bacterium]|nr:hypothetical protein [Gammaproteobacteria bacterium]